MIRALIALALSATLLAFGSAGAQEKPRYGGELIFPVPSEPPSYDGHREGTFGTVHPFAPVYNTLLRIDPTDKTGTRPVPDLARPGTVFRRTHGPNLSICSCVSSQTAAS